MTDRELLEMLVKGMGEINSRLDNVESELKDLRSELNDVKSDVASLQAAQLRTTAALEGTIDKCIQVLYESHTLNTERLDKFDVEKVKINSEIAVTVAKMAYDEVMRKVS